MKYRANPVAVDAFVIVTVRPIHLEPFGFTLLLDNGRWVHATAEMSARMTPIVGDYWVIQEDGYVYLNPKSVFERKYSSVPWPTPKRPTIAELDAILNSEENKDIVINPDGSISAI